MGESWSVATSLSIERGQYRWRSTLNLLAPTAEMHPLIFFPALLPYAHRTIAGGKSDQRMVQEGQLSHRQKERWTTTAALASMARAPSLELPVGQG